MTMRKKYRFFVLTTLKPLKDLPLKTLESQAKQGLNLPLADGETCFTGLQYISDTNTSTWVNGLDCTSIMKFYKMILYST